MTEEGVPHGLGRRIARLRKDRGLVQKQLAARAGTSTSQISRYERGAAEPSLLSLLPLCQALGVTPNDLLLGLGEEQVGETQ